MIYGKYITPTEAIAMGDTRSATELVQLAEATEEYCTVCHQPVWKYAGQGMCFTCTTGTWDASDDCELIPEKGRDTDD